MRAQRILLGLAAVAAAILLLTASGRTLRWSVPGVELSGSTGGLRAVLLCYVAVLGCVVASYAATNLRGQRRQGRFAALLVATVGGLAVMVTASSLVTAALGLTLSSVALAGLVAHRGDAAAHRASRLVLRRLLVGDAAVWSAALAAEAGAGRHVVGVLLVVGVVVRSALVPAHRWLPETAEAPSPVSALLHAGVVNGGAMLCLLFWPQVSGSRAALAVLLAAGAASVVLGLVGMRLRPDVKGRLAASTTAQLGLVAVQLGLALPTVAVLHVLGHGCWKAWLFLRAGGAAGRVQPPSERASGAAPVAAGAAAALGTAAVGVAAAGSLDAPGSPAFAAALVAVVAGVGVHEALRLERTRLAQRSALAVVVVTAAAGYVAATGRLEELTHDWFAAGAEPSSVAAALAAAVVLAALGAAVVGLRPSSSGALATAVAASLLPPGGRARGSVRTLPDRAAAADLGGLPVEHVGLTADLAAVVVGPAWPLSSLVAANPLAPLETMSAEDAAAVVRRVHGRDPRPRLALFLDLHARGVVSDRALRQALAEHQPRSWATGALGGASVEDVVACTRALAAQGTDTAPLRVRACDRVGATAVRRLELQAAAWTARAWATTAQSGRPGTDPATDPWTLWRRSAAHRSADLAWGVRGASALARSLPADPARALAVLWPHVQRLTGEQDFYSYAVSQLASGRGWTAHARWRARESGGAAPVVQLLALRTVLDVLLAECSASEGRSRAAGPPAPEADLAIALEVTSVWQRALDLSARRGLLHSLAVTTTARATARATDEPLEPPPTAHSVWCIDARSERVRRALESTPGHQTHGYAGFFGAALRHRAVDGTVTDLAPGLLRPSLSTEDADEPLTWAAAAHALVTRIGQHPAAAFGWAETSGVPALAASVAASVAPARWRRLARRFTGDPTRVPPLAVPLPTAAGADVAEALLRTTGLAGSTAPVVVLVGHASSTENNAFASAYDCGACGGHSGARNAAVVAAALGDPAVREELARRGVPVPAGTTFVAALHDTTTDEVVLLPEGASTRAASAARLDEVAAALRDAGRAAARERAALLPGGRRTVADRAADWAEPMPEWGLAGNLALVVGPRWLTRDLDLGGTAFLHSYEPGSDPDGAVLEQVMTGPVLVTQWINAQYYASTSAPELLGAGDKTTHNVVGDVGVLTGAHGDLRTGLPWQSFASGDPTGPDGDVGALRHLPARHLVVLHADPDLVRQVVRRHTELAQTVGNGWLQLVAQPPGTGSLLELDRHLAWRPCTPTAPALRPAAGAGDPPARV